MKPETDHVMDETHASDLTSWVPGANDPAGDFPLQNLPFGVFAVSRGADPRLGVAIGDCVLDLRGAADEGLLSALASECLQATRAPTLNALMGLGPRHWQALRLALSRLLRQGASARARAEALLRPRSDVQMRLPAAIGDYTDFYTSIHHATNAGRLFRPDNPLYPNFVHLPVGYHGRASSIVVSGQPCRRPMGQLRRASDGAPVFAASEKLDFELELAAFVGPGNALGVSIPIAEAEQHVFGMCILNDWSARDIQSWEYQPLGPFLGKSFMTSISPWVVTMAALAPFRKRREVPEDAAGVLPYLDQSALATGGAIDIVLEVALETAESRRRSLGPMPLSRTSFADQYWSVFQMLVHHASNGCNLQPGDLFGTGTISGEGPGEEGCLLEKAKAGKDPVSLPTGETRSFLQDGDEVVMKARCTREGFASIGFGECRGRVEPASTP